MIWQGRAQAGPGPGRQAGRQGVTTSSPAPTSVAVAVAVAVTCRRHGLLQGQAPQAGPHAPCAAVQLIRPTKAPRRITTCCCAQSALPGHMRVAHAMRGSCFPIAQERGRGRGCGGCCGRQRVAAQGAMRQLQPRQQLRG